MGCQHRSLIRKIVVFAAIVLAISFSMQSPPRVASETLPAKSKVINVVMDDSGSMLFKDGINDASGTESNPALTRWAKARYALNTMVAMLGEKDTLNVYYLNDASRVVTVTGAESSKSRVDKIRDYVPKSGGTPAEAVTNAQNALVTAKGDEKYLLIISDGEFDGVSAQDLVSKIDASKPENESVMFLGIGDKAPVFKDAKHASDSGDEILSEIVNLSNEIYGRLAMPDEAKVGNDGLMLDVPLDKLVVFAQGKDISTPEIVVDGQTYKASQTVTMKPPTAKEAAQLAEIEPVTLDKIKVDDNLQGIVAEFENIPKGDATIKIKNAKQIDYYYEPKIQLGITFTNDETGEVINPIEEENKIIEGDYTINYGAVDGDGNFIASNLLGEPKVLESSFIGADGQKTSVTDGDSIKLDRGEIQVHIKEEFLDRYVADAILPYGQDDHFHIMEAATPLKLKETDDPSMGVKDLKAAQTFKIKITKDGVPPEEANLTQDEWDRLEDLKIKKLTAGKKNRDIDLSIKKTKDPGYAEVTVSANDGDIYETQTGQITYEASASIPIEGGREHHGYLKSDVEVDNNLTPWDRFWHFILEHLLWIILALLLITIIVMKILQPKLPKYLKAHEGFTRKGSAGKRTPIKSKFEFRSSQFKNRYWFWRPQTVHYKPFGQAGPRLYLEATRKSKFAGPMVKNASSLTSYSTFKIDHSKIADLVEEQTAKRPIIIDKNSEFEWTDTKNQARYYKNTIS